MTSVMDVNSGEKSRCPRLCLPGIEAVIVRPTVDGARGDPSRAPEYVGLMGPVAVLSAPEWGPVLPRFLAGTFDGAAEAVSRTGFFGARPVGLVVLAESGNPNLAPAALNLL